MTEPRRTQEARRAEAEQRLRAAAAELIGQVGPSRVTLANIGERAGYSRGLTTHHFGSKGAMMQRLVDSVTVKLRQDVLAESASDSALDEALGLVRAYFHALAHPEAANRARLVCGPTPWPPAHPTSARPCWHRTGNSATNSPNESNAASHRANSPGRPIRARSRRSSSACCGASRCSRCSTTGSIGRVPRRGGDSADRKARAMKIHHLNCGTKGSPGAPETPVLFGSDTTYSRPDGH